MPHALEKSQQLRKGVLKLERVIVCECVNIQYKRLEQLSGASLQTLPGFGFQLAAGGFRGPERH